MGAVGKPELVQSEQSAVLLWTSLSVSASVCSQLQANTSHSSVWLLSMAQCYISPAVQLPVNSEVLAKGGQIFLYHRMQTCLKTEGLFHLGHRIVMKVFRFSKRKILLS